MDEKKSLKKKILHWVLLVAIASGLALVVLLLIMFSIMKDEGFFDKSGEKTAKEEIWKVPKFSKDIKEEPPTGILVELRNEDIFETGYYEYYFDVFTSGVVYISSLNDQESDMEWRVYFSDTKLSEEEIYALKDTEPVAVNTGEAKIIQGQWIYILSNINAQTSEAPSASMISITCIRDYI